MSARHHLTSADRHPLAGANPLPPHLMTAEQRLDELAGILTAGLLRLRQKQKNSGCNDLRDFRLDFPPDRSVHATTRKRRKVAR